jgi:hypothetical protein
VIRTLHDAVARASLAEKDPAGATKRVMSDLGLPQAAFPVILRTVAGHLRLVERGAGIDPGL